MGKQDVVGFPVAVDFGTTYLRDAICEEVMSNIQQKPDLESREKKIRKRTHGNIPPEMAV